MQRVINSLAQSIHCFSPMKGALVHPSWRSQMSCSLVPSSTLKNRCDRMTLQDSCPVAQSHRKESNINEYSNESVWRVQKEIYVVYYPVRPFSPSCCVVVDCNKTLGEDAKERLCPNESQWEWMSIWRLTADWLNEDWVLSSGLTRATCIAFLFQRSK